MEFKFAYWQEANKIIAVSEISGRYLIVTDGFEFMRTLKFFRFLSQKELDYFVPKIFEVKTFQRNGKIKKVRLIGFKKTKNLCGLAFITQDIVNKLKAIRVSGLGSFVEFVKIGNVSYSFSDLNRFQNYCESLPNQPVEFEPKFNKCTQE